MLFGVRELYKICNNIFNENWIWYSYSNITHIDLADVHSSDMSQDAGPRTMSGKYFEMVTTKIFSIKDTKIFRTISGIFSQARRTVSSFRGADVLAMRTGSWPRISVCPRVTWPDTCPTLFPWELHVDQFNNIRMTTSLRIISDVIILQSQDHAPTDSPGSTGMETSAECMKIFRMIFNQNQKLKCLGLTMEAVLEIQITSSLNLNALEFVS